MISVVFSVLFVSFLLLTLVFQFWLASRHIRHILSNRVAVPAQFAEKISLASHKKAADYTIAKTKLGVVMLMVNAVVLLGFTLFGGLQWLSVHLVKLTGPGMGYQISLLATFALISGVLEFPFTYYSQFVLEEKFGFNKMTLGLFFRDMAVNALLACVLGLPLVWVILTLMEKAGSLWWLYAWAFFIAFQMLIMMIFPVVIAPLFNKFWPLDNAEVRERIENLSKRVNFALKGIFVMDGSKRSGHGNAYFSGFGGAKRIVFYDTLLERLAPNEIEAVLAHELGHFKLKHIIKRMAVMFALSLGFMAMLGFFKDQVWFYTGLGVDPMLLAQNDAMAMILFMLALPVFTFVFSPLGAITSRKHEFEADAFAARHTNAADLITALVKMYDDNSSTLTPDPLHSAFYDSHPSASVRINHLLAAQ
ncbi:M48 family metallopeptidase [Undibacterium sp. TS12]|uniref:M48 family metallopeptidase n=1 Tax=Undibacterium sp. TS12 TaxID=2908202 RepID=UPI001F4CE941|nr:M48 family metallopeptidase [Undibacterium sp. TS12]MCH8622420.1 M48 family metallopeptidase [Undibacterium sp. TS12]